MNYWTFYLWWWGLSVLNYRPPPPILAFKHSLSQYSEFTLLWRLEYYSQLINASQLFHVCCVCYMAVRMHRCVQGHLPFSVCEEVRGWLWVSTSTSLHFVFWDRLWLNTELTISAALVSFLLLGWDVMTKATHRERGLGAYNFRASIHDRHGRQHGSRKAGVVPRQKLRVYILRHNPQDRALTRNGVGFLNLKA